MTCITYTQVEQRVNFFPVKYTEEHFDYRISAN